MGGHLQLWYQCAVGCLLRARGPRGHGGGGPRIDLPRRAQPGFRASWRGRSRRHRSADQVYRPGRPGAGDHPTLEGDHCRPPVGSSVRHGRHPGHRLPPRPAGTGRLFTRPREPVQGAPLRHLRRRRGFLPPSQQSDLRRGRRHPGHKRLGGSRPGDPAGALSRPLPRGPDRRSTARLLGNRVRAQAAHVAL